MINDNEYGADIILSIKQLKCGKSLGMKSFTLMQQMKFPPYWKTFLIVSSTLVHFSMHGDGAFYVQNVRVAQYLTLVIFGEFH